MRRQVIGPRGKCVASAVNIPTFAIFSHDGDSVSEQRVVEKP